MLCALHVLYVALIVSCVLYLLCVLYVVCAVCAAASVTASLHYNATLAPSDSIFVLADKLAGSSAPDLLNEESSVQIDSPKNPPVPLLVPEVSYTALAHCKVSRYSL